MLRKVYNKLGTYDKQNSSLRLPNNYKELQPIDLQVLLKAAIIARGKEFASKHASLIEKLS